MEDGAGGKEKALHSFTDRQDSWRPGVGKGRWAEAGWFGREKPVPHPKADWNWVLENEVLNKKEDYQIKLEDVIKMPVYKSQESQEA